MKTVYCIGETVFDLIFKDGEPLAAKPGGSMLNSAVSLGRAGVPVHFISEYGTDCPGNFIDKFLQTNRVNTMFIHRHMDGKTSLALAFLDGNNQADYSFYKQHPKKRMNILFPEAGPGDIVLFGSHFSLQKDIRARLVRFIRKARNAGAIIIYDPNFRKPHLPELGELLPRIRENISLSDMVRGSDEDFLHIFGARNGEIAFKKVSNAGCKILVYTKNKKGIELFTEKKRKVFPVKPVKTVSTIGAGDAFNAGLIFGLVDLQGRGVNRDEGKWKISAEKWPYLIDMGQAFAGKVCQTLDNYICEEFAKGLKHAKMVV